MRRVSNQTCNSIDALAHNTALLMDGNPLAKERSNPINLSGDELTMIVTSSMPSLPIIDQPSSLKPLSASLKPLKYKIRCQTKILDAEKLLRVMPKK